MGTAGTGERPSGFRVEVPGSALLGGLVGPHRDRAVRLQDRSTRAGRWSRAHLRY